MRSPVREGWAEQGPLHLRPDLPGTLSPQRQNWGVQPGLPTCDLNVCPILTFVTLSAPQLWCPPPPTVFLFTGRLLRDIPAPAEKGPLICMLFCINFPCCPTASLLGAVPFPSRPFPMPSPGEAWWVESSGYAPTGPQAPRHSTVLFLLLLFRS